MIVLKVTKNQKNHKASMKYHSFPITIYIRSKIKGLDMHFLLHPIKHTLEKIVVQAMQLIKNQ